MVYTFDKKKKKIKILLESSSHCRIILFVEEAG